MKEALAILEASTFDLVVSDIGMPEGDGYDFVKAMREQETRMSRPKTPTNALTAYARTEDRRRVILAGFQAHVAKPVESGELPALVARQTGRV